MKKAVARLKNNDPEYIVDVPPNVYEGLKEMEKRHRLPWISGRTGISIGTLHSILNTKLIGVEAKEKLEKFLPENI